MTYDGNNIGSLSALVDDKLRGVQLSLGGSGLSYRAASDNGTLVLCNRHLDLRRGAGESWKLTGESFPEKECDDCTAP